MEWMDVELSVDLLVAAQRLLHFLDKVDNNEKLLTDATLECALRRYEQLWLPLAHENRNIPIVAPIDIAWLWHCHMLAPLAYRRDCRKILKRTLHHAFPDENNIIEYTNNTIELWYEKYPKDGFNIIRNGMSVLPKPECTQLTTEPSRLTIDLVQRATDQLHFCYQVALPHFRDRKYLENALVRYKQFMCLKRKNPDEFLTPSVDILLMWFSHMCYPLEYAQDTMKVCGTVLDNNVRLQAALLNEKYVAAQDNTEKLWRSVSPDPMVKPGTKFRTNKRRKEIAQMNTGDLRASCVVVYTLNLFNVELIGLPSQMRHFTFDILRHHVHSHLEEIQTLKGSKRQRLWTFRSSFQYNDLMHEGLQFVVTKPSRIGWCWHGDRIYASGLLSLKPTLDKISSLEQPTLYLEAELAAPDNSPMKVVVRGKVDNILPQLCDLTLNKGTFHKQIVTFKELLRSWGEAALPRTAKHAHDCYVAVHRLQNHEEVDCFRCRVIHIPHLLLSGVQVYFGNKLVATAHAIGSSQLPTPDQVEQGEDAMAFDPEEGERAILIRNCMGDWGLCIGHWVSAESPASEFLKIRFLKLTGKGTMQRLEIKTADIEFLSFNANICTGRMYINPVNNTIAENLALIFSIGVLYVLCSPKRPGRELTITGLSVPGVQNGSEDGRSIEASRTELNSAAKDVSVYESTCQVLLAAGLDTSTPSNQFIESEFGSLSYDLTMDAQDVIVVEHKTDRKLFKKESKLMRCDTEDSDNMVRKLKKKKHSKLKESPTSVDHETNTGIDNDKHDVVSDSKAKEGSITQQKQQERKVARKRKRIRKRQSSKLDDILSPSDDSLDEAIKEEKQFMEGQLDSTNTEGFKAEEVAIMKRLKKKKSSNMEDELTPSDDSLDKEELEEREFKEATQDTIIAGVRKRSIDHRAGTKLKSLSDENPTIIVSKNDDDEEANKIVDETIDKTVMERELSTIKEIIERKKEKTEMHMNHVGANTQETSANSRSGSVTPPVETIQKGKRLTKHNGRGGGGGERTGKQMEDPTVLEVKQAQNGVDS